MLARVGEEIVRLVINRQVLFKIERPVIGQRQSIEIFGGFQRIAGGLAAVPIDQIVHGPDVGAILEMVDQLDD